MACRERLRIRQRRRTTRHIPAYHPSLQACLTPPNIPQVAVRSVADQTAVLVLLPRPITPGFLHGVIGRGSRTRTAVWSATDRTATCGMFGGVKHACREG